MQSQKKYINAICIYITLFNFMYQYLQKKSISFHFDYIALY